MDTDDEIFDLVWETIMGLDFDPDDRPDEDGVEVFQQWWGSYYVG